MTRLPSLSLRWSPALLLWLVVGASQAADLVVYVPDGPQDASQMVAAFAPLQAKARDSSLELSGHYFVQLADFQKFIDSKRPGFGVVDALLTNFHLPESSLLVLVAAFAGRERVLAAYHHAIAARYRYYSYGDAMFVTPDPAVLAPRGAPA